MKTIIRGYIYSAGILLLSMATALFIANLTSLPCYVPCHDPLLNLKLSTLFWIIGGIELVAGTYCIFGKKESPQLMLILWLGINATGCWLALVFKYATGGFTGYLGNVADAFGISCAMANNVVCAAIIYLLIGSFVMLISMRVGRAALRRGQTVDQQIKLACAHCGGRVQFAAIWFGQTIPCPHCQKSITLRNPLPHL